MLFQPFLLTPIILLNILLGNIAEDSIKTKQYGISILSSDASKKAIDGKEHTYSKTNITNGSGQQYYTIKFNKTYEVLGLIIKVPPEDVGECEIMFSFSYTK